MTEIFLTSSVLILFLVVLRRLLRRRIHPTVQYALWLLVAARLLIPGSLFTAPVSVMGAAGELHTAIENTFHTESNPGTISAYAPPDYIPPGNTEARGDAEITYYPPGEAGSAPVTATNPADVIWKAGIALTGTVLLLSNLTFYGRLRKRRQPIAPQELPFPCRVPVYVVPELPSPCLFGLLRPAIYINREALHPQRLTHILTHETAHLRHGDHLWALLRSLCLTLHWYNPLVWWAALLSRRDCELSCDAAVIRRLGEGQRILYGQTLLSMVLPHTAPADLLRTATTMTAGKRAMVERITFIASRPRTLKLTLAAALLLTGAAAAFTFGGAAPAVLPAPAPPEEAAPLPESVDTGDPAAPELTEAEALALYAQARQAWDWFELGLLPTTEEALAAEGSTYLRCADFDTLESLRQHLLTLFSPQLTESLLTGYLPLRESGGGLYVLPGSRGRSPYAGAETVSAFPLTAREAALQGYHCHIYTATEVLDLYDARTVLYQKRHDWYISWNGERYVFTAFGPWDDVDPQRYYNALTILDHYQRGNGIITWFPMLENLDWNALRATQPLWPEGFDLGLYVLEALSDYTEQESSFTVNQLLHILSGCEGLDGAYSELYGVIVYRLYEKTPAGFARTVLEALSENHRAQVLDHFRFEEPFHRPPSADAAPLPRQAAADMLRSVFTESFVTYTHSDGLFSLTLPDRACRVEESATGVKLTLDGEGWTFRLLSQPSLWLDVHPTEAIVLGSFDTNGTEQTYLLETNAPDSPATQLLAESFRLHISPEHISALVNAGLSRDIAGSIRYLPYLSWLNYRQQYGEDGLSRLLQALCAAAETGSLTWEQYHDLLSPLPDEALDGANARLYTDLLHTLYRKDPRQFASVVLSQFISSEERESALSLLELDEKSLQAAAG